MRGSIITASFIAEKNVSLMVLKPNQEIFADEYLMDLNAIKAYKVDYSKVKKDETAAGT